MNLQVKCIIPNKNGHHSLNLRHDREPEEKNELVIVVISFVWNDDMNKEAAKITGT